jgi:spore germination protein YaaH
MAAPIAKPQNSNAIATIPFINKLPTSFSIQPNPFSQTAQLTYQLESSTTVTISIYNVYGQLVQTLLNNELKEKGIVTATIDRANLAIGIYFVQLKTDNYINRMKVVLQ